MSAIRIARRLKLNLAEGYFLTTSRILTAELLSSLRATAQQLDRENLFAASEINLLKEAGYLAQFTAPDASLIHFLKGQYSLAQASAGVALGVNMHLLWTAVAHTLLKTSVENAAVFQKILEDAEEGHVFAFGVSEAGNDQVLFDSRSRATKVPGGYEISGTKIFTSLSPLWTRLGVHARTELGELVFAIIDAESNEGRIDRGANWDVLGMRASYSCTTKLRGAFVPESNVLSIHPSGVSAEPLSFWIFALFELSVCSVYAGLAHRAVELYAEALKAKGPALSSDIAPRENLAVRALFGQIATEAEGVTDQVFGLARELFEDGRPSVAWYPRLSGLKYRVTDVVTNVVQRCLAGASGAAFSNTSELSRLYRDVAALPFHPSSATSALEAQAQRYLGPIDSSRR